MVADRLTEHWDIYNHQFQRIGDRQRHETLASGEFHLVVNAFIFNTAGSVLLQQRVADKINFPNYWDCSAGGSVLAGETIEAGMQRELAEELGFHRTVTSADNFWIRSYSHWVEAWFAFQTTQSLSDLTPQHAELQRIAYFTPDVAERHLTQIGFNNYHLELKRAWTHLQQRK